MVNRYLGFPFVHPLTRLDTNTITKCLTTWFMDWGIPTWLCSDRGPQFRGPFEQFCKDRHIMHELSSPYKPRSNGHIEAAVKNIKYLLEKHHAHWDMFKEALLEWWNTPRPDNLSPAQLMTGHHQHMMQMAHPAAYKHICTGPPPPLQVNTNMAIRSTQQALGHYRQSHQPAWKGMILLCRSGWGWDIPTKCQVPLIDPT